MSDTQDLVNELQIQARACRQVSQNSSWALLCERAADAIEARGKVIESAVNANLELQVQRADLIKALAGLLSHANIADAAPEDVDEEDRALERVARAALARAT